MFILGGKGWLGSSDKELKRAGEGTVKELIWEELELYLAFATIQHCEELLKSWCFVQRISIHDRF